MAGHMPGVLEGQAMNAEKFQDELTRQEIEMAARLYEKAFEAAAAGTFKAAAACKSACQSASQWRNEVEKALKR